MTFTQYLMINGEYDDVEARVIWSPTYMSCAWKSNQIHG